MGVAASFAARNPDVVITEEHPADGTYDCLTIPPGSGVRMSFDAIHLNRHGNGHVWSNHDNYWNWSGMWTELAVNHDVDYAARVLEHHAGIVPAQAGATSSEACEGPRFIAQLLLSTAVRTLDHRRHRPARVGLGRLPSHMLVAVPRHDSGRSDRHQHRNRLASVG